MYQEKIHDTYTNQHLNSSHQDIKISHDKVSSVVIILSNYVTI